MGGLPITSLNAVNAILKIMAIQALRKLKTTLIMGALVNRDYESALATQGDTVNVKIPPVMTSVNLAEGGSLTNQNPSLGNAQITLNYHETAAFQVTDISKVFAGENLADLYMQGAIQAIAEAIETAIMNEYVKLTDNTAVGSATASISETAIDDAETSLFTAKVPQNEPKYLVVNAATYSDMRQLQKFSERSSIGEPSTGVIQTGMIQGTVKGFQVYRSHHVARPSTTTYNLAFARDCFALVMRKMPPTLPGVGVIAEYAEEGGYGVRVLTSYVHGYLGTQFSVDALFGVGVLRSNFGVQVLSNT